MKITVITATYNSEKFLNSTINSVTNQTHDDVEYIIIDGESSDNTLKITRDREAEIDRFISEKDDGIYSALNKGLELSTGEIVCFLHSDDEFASADVLKMVADEFEKSDADVVYGDLVYNSREKENKLIRSWKAGNYSKNSIFFGWMPPHTATFVKRELYMRIGLFNTKLRISADYELFLRLFSLSNLNVVYLPALLIKMRVGGLSNGSLLDIIQKSKEDYLGLKLNNRPLPIISLFFKNIRKISQLINF